MTHIFLYGPSGTGKSTIGKALARNLNVPFIDSDQLIEINAGKSIAMIVEEQGMPKVRDLESNALKHIISDQDGVVALGGGALLRNENRMLVENNGRVFLLSAELPTLLERLENDPNERPLLEGDLKSKLSSYLDERAEHYSSFPLIVQVDGKSVEQIAHHIQLILGRHHLSAMGEYDVLVGHVSVLANFHMQNPIIVTDENVAKFHLASVASALQASGHKSNTVILPAGEDHKNLELVSHLWKDFLENGLDRKSTVIALGGGVVSDMAGFAASTYMRGIDWLAVPTTLLSMVDASLGGKTGIDLPEGKNLIGSFHPPKLVLADPSFLLTLTELELRSGMAEVVKHGIISDPELFKLCSRGISWVKENLEEIIKRAMAVKIKIIEEDPYEKGIRASLNLGHTVGHAVEVVSNFKLRHGEAVAIGMAVEARYSARIGLADQKLVEAVEETLSGLGLPIQIPDGVSHEEIVRAMHVDKKKDAEIMRFALPVEIGKVELVAVRESDLGVVIASTG